jgi:hypothetical protein
MYFKLGTLGIGVAAFLLVYCGMPAEISVVRETPDVCCYLRSDRKLYNIVHSLWHLASGCGPVLSTWLFMHIATNQLHIDHFFTPAKQIISFGPLSLYRGQDVVIGLPYYLDPYQWLPVVPTVALIISAIINLFGNLIGIMPLN